MCLDHLRDCRTYFCQLGCQLVVMMKPSQDRNCHHLAHCMLRGTRRFTRLRNLLTNTLMRSSPIEVGHIVIEHTMELLLMQDQQVIKTFLSHTSQEAFADRIRSGSMIWRFENLNATRCRHPSKVRPKFAIVITNQVLWCLPIRRSFPKLLRNPEIGRRPCHAYVDHLP